MENKKNNLSDAESKAVGYDDERKPVGYGSSMQSDGFANEMHGNNQLKLEVDHKKMKRVQFNQGLPK